MHSLLPASFLLCLVKISIEFSYELDEKFLFKFGRGCKSMDIRFDYRYLERLAGCKTIHGYLRISDVDIPSNAIVAYNEIYEVTGYVLVNNVTGLVSLSEILPNISVIRGEILNNQGYSLIVTENHDLDNIGTGLLTQILEGNVRIKNNPALCYIDTVNWTRLRSDIVVENENNNPACNQSCINCWSESIPQWFSDQCELSSVANKTICCDHTCLGGCTDQKKDCFACRHYKDVTENSTTCTDIHEAGTFVLEDRFLINEEICDEMGKTKFEYRCIPTDKCPLFEEYRLFNGSCEFCGSKCPYKECSIVLNTIDDLKNLTECNAASILEIRNLSDNKDENIRELLREKLENIIEIKSCLIVSNSTAITDFWFLKNLRSISATYAHPSCTIEGKTYSVIIIKNMNLRKGLPNGIQISIHASVLIENNVNLCRNDAKALSNNFYYFNGSSPIIQPTDCTFPITNVNIIPAHDSALILFDFMDGPKSRKYRFFPVYWKDDNGNEQVRRLSQNHDELTDLKPNTTYKFKLAYFMEHDRSVSYSTNFKFFKTLSYSEYYSGLKVFSDLHSINITWTSLASSVSEIDLSDYILYITYQEAKGDCTSVKLIDHKDFKMTAKYRKYFLRNPYNEFENFKQLKYATAYLTDNQINITNLQNSTCYRLDIYPCSKRNSIMCHLRKTLYHKTLVISSSLVNTFIIPATLMTVLLILSVIVVKYLMPRVKKTDKEINQEIVEFDNRGMSINEWEIDREKIVQTKILGRGEFGIVHQGYIEPNHENLYAIKTLSPDKEFYEESFLKEAQLMRKFDANHVVKLIGYCLKDKPLLVVMELMVHGDLKKFLHKNQPIEKSVAQNVQAIAGNYTTAPVSKQTLHPIRPVADMAIEIADGMLYLSSINFIHCDLACRNLMVHESYTIKIGDFGMARELYHTDYYKLSSRNKVIPLRWMAPEVLGTNDKLPQYTTMSDVFSFGIVLYELVTFCEMPYAGCLDEDVMNYIKAGRILEKPKNCDEKMYELMKKCWRFNPEERITFRQIVENLLEMCDIPNFENVSFYHKITTRL